MFGWMKKIKKQKKEDEVFVITPDDVPEEITPDEIATTEDESVKFKETGITFEEKPKDLKEEKPKDLKEENPKDWVDLQVKEIKEKKENIKPKKNATGSQADADLGRLNLRKHVIAKRREYLTERKKYEKEYLARLKKQQKAKPKKSSSLKPDADLGRLNLRKHVIAKRREYLTERKKYEKEYLARLKKQQKAKPKKKKSRPRKR